MPLFDSIFLCISFIVLLTVYAVTSEAIKSVAKNRRKKNNVRLVYSGTTKKEHVHNDELTEEAV